jgi:histidinol phosphatase-like PHP family hydrolase
VAIEAVANAIIEMEKEAVEDEGVALEINTSNAVHDPTRWA